MDKHVADELLVAHLDGELAPKDEARVARHLKECWHCRSRASAFSEQMRLLARERDAQPFPSPHEVDEARREFFARFEEATARQHRRWPWVGMPPRSWSWKPALALGVLVGVFVGLWFVPRHRSAPQSAADVLASIERSENTLRAAPGYFHQAIRVEVSLKRPTPLHWRGELEVWADSEGNRYSSRWRDSAGRLRYAAWRTAGGEEFATDATLQLIPAPSPPAAHRVALIELWGYGLAAGRIEDAFLDWMRSRRWQPVSFAADFRAFADGEGAVLKVERLAPAPGRPVLRLSASRVVDGVLVTLVLEADADSHRPRLEYVSFEGGGRSAEVRFVAYRMERLPPVQWLAAVFEPPTPRRSRRRRIIPASPSQPLVALKRVPTQAELDAAEIEVRYALHRLGVCLGEPVRIERDTSRVRVRGVVDSAERRREIVVALAQVEDPGLVEANIQTIEEALTGGPNWAAPGETGQSAARKPTIAESDLPLRNRFLEYFRQSGSSEPAAARLTAFVNSALDITAAALDQAWALRRLAERYPPDEVSRLNVQSRWLLEVMVRAHLATLQQKMASAETLLAPVFSSVAGIPRVPNSPARAPLSGVNWAQTALAIFSRVNRVHDLVHGVLGGGAAPDTDQAPKESRKVLVRDAEQAMAESLALMRTVRGELRQAKLLAAEELSTEGHVAEIARQTESPE